MNASIYVHESTENDFAHTQVFLNTCKHLLPLKSSQTTMTIENNSILIYFLGNKSNTAQGLNINS